MSEAEPDFAAFEAAAKDTPIADTKVGDPEPAAKVEEPLELTDADEAVDLEDGEEGGEEGHDEDGKRRRSKPASQRLAEERWKRGEVERENENLKARLDALEKGKPAETALPERPDPAQFEFGESDPDYIDKLTDWKLDAREAEKAKAAEANQSHQTMIDTINTGVAKAEENAKAKYDDFDAKIAEAVEARGGEPMPPLLTIGIGVSPVGHDILYRIATDEAASTKLERLAKGGMQSSNALAMALGELEGEYLDDDSDSDLDLTDNLDMARMMGRMRSRLKGAKAPEQRKVSVTNAPEPPEQRARGGSGQFQPNPATTDFASFERLAAKR